MADDAGENNGRGRVTGLLELCPFTRSRTTQGLSGGTVSRNPTHLVLALLAATLLGLIAIQHPDAIPALTLAVAVFVAVVALLP
ncbi:hypothetical protein [Streptomyces sp. NPDC127066]|uniref:hypothetical protein n=1 Tax=Streptomyces sp. NPDC127066 TaxID=3347125 RepID=UPI003648FF8E